MPQIVRQLFERELRERLNVPHAIAVNSGTSALVATLLSLEMQPGDEVVTTPFTFAATTFAILLAGGTPVFADISPETHLINPEKVRALMGPRTRAILPVHLFGRVCGMDWFRSSWRDSDVPIVEDAAQAFGATWSGRLVGTIGDAGCFSFYKTKNLSTFEGGAVVIRKGSCLDADKIRSIANPTDNKRDYLEVGHNFRMPEPCALIGLERLRLHWDQIKSGLGAYDERDGFYPYVTYQLEACRKRGITGNCPVAEKVAARVKKGGYPCRES